MSVDWQKLRSDFPIAKKYIYLDHASCGPMPVPVRDAIRVHLDELTEESDFAWLRWMKKREEVRAQVARFIHAEPGEIAFTTSTSHGMNLIADCLSPEGAVLTNELEFPSSTVPWLWRKTPMRFQSAEDGKVPLEKLAGLLTPEIKTIVSSLVQYKTGFRQDVEGTSRVKGDRCLVVNATQGFGVLPVDVRTWNVDFLCTNSYKWLFAGYGGGILYMRKKWIEKFRPSWIGWRSMKDPEAMDNRGLDVREDASRYELGCPNFTTLTAIGASIDYLSGIGMEAIEKRILDLTGYLIEKLEEKGYEVITSKHPEERAGIVVFKMRDAEVVWKKLLGKGIYTSPRGGGLRVAPHFYNTHEELDALMKEMT